MTIELSTGLRQAMLNATGMKGAFTNGVLYIWTGQPPGADAAATGTLLMKVTKDHGEFVFGAATNGINLDAPVAGVINKAAAENWQGVAIAPGVAGYFRYMGNAADNLGVSTTLPRMEGTIGTGSGGDLNLVTTTFDIGTPASIDVYRYTLLKS